MKWYRQQLFGGIALLVLLPAGAGMAQTPIRIGINAEFSVPLSTSAQAVSLGAKIAVAEINAAGGVLGRKFELVERDHRAVPARAANNIEQFAADLTVVAELEGKFSAVVVESIPLIHRLNLPMLVPWAAADQIIDNGNTPNYVFRYSLRDSWALDGMVRHASGQRYGKVALLVPNNEWGRSSERAATRATTLMGALPGQTRIGIVGTYWYNLGEDTSLTEKYQLARAAGAEALLLVANEREGAALIKGIAALPKAERMPVIAHWGISGGAFVGATGESLREVDLVFVQSFSFINNASAKSKAVLAAAKAAGATDDPRKLASPIGVAHAYDLIHLLAMAIKKAGSTDREKVRDALENLGPYDGLVAKLARPFSPQSHEALSAKNVRMARYAADGAIELLPLK